MDKAGRSRGSISYEDDNDDVYVAMGVDVEESQPNLTWALSNLTPNKVCILHVHVPPLSIPFRSAMFLKTVGRENRLREYQEIERRKVERVINGYLRICVQEEVAAEILFFTRDSIEKGIIEFICTHGIKKLVIGAKKAGYVCKYAPNFCYIWVISQGFFSYSRQIHQGSPNTYQKPQQEAGERTELSYDDDHHVYVAIGEDVEESEPNLIWALCNLKPKQICILHVHVPPLDVPFRSALFLKSAGRENRIKEYQEVERRKVENIVNGYLRICDQAGVLSVFFFLLFLLNRKMGGNW
ncbi:hypothetical protein LIER_34450 [Lithospermum erythrorhizon]|uniref:RING-type E3 ubiquitin transferase n=1 Tax=Lithospermum erythrorhizon TaxID=34254 RepID=A0AAV3S0Y7_LITER